LSQWPSVRARRLLSALKQIGWVETRVIGSHRRLEREGWAPITFAFHDSEEIGPRMLSKIAKETGLKPGDL